MTISYKQISILFFLLRRHPWRTFFILSKANQLITRMPDVGPWIFFLSFLGPPSPGRQCGSYQLLNTKFKKDERFLRAWECGVCEWRSSAFQDLKLFLFIFIPLSSFCSKLNECSFLRKPSKTVVFYALKLTQVLLYPA